MSFLQKVQKQLVEIEGLLRFVQFNSTQEIPVTLHMNDIRGFPKVDHLDINARTVLEQNEFSKKKRYL